MASQIDRILRDVKSTLLPIDKIKQSDVIVINTHLCSDIAITKSKTRPEQQKCHITGISIFDNKRYETICHVSNMFVKILPLECNMTIVAINNDKCDLSFYETIIKDISLPKKYISDITNAYSDELIVNVSVDNYLDIFYKINEYWI